MRPLIAAGSPVRKAMPGLTCQSFVLETAQHVSGTPADLHTSAHSLSSLQHVSALPPHLIGKLVLAIERRGGGSGLAVVVRGEVAVPVRARPWSAVALVGPCNTRSPCRRGSTPHSQSAPSVPLQVLSMRPRVAFATRWQRQVDTRSQWERAFKMFTTANHLPCTFT